MATVRGKRTNHGTGLVIKICLALVFPIGLLLLFNAVALDLATGETLITVIIPCYNCDRSWLQETLSSLDSQTFLNFSTILVDDGSVEAVPRDSLAYSRRLQVLRHHRNLGLSAARNTGVLAAQSPYVIFLDPDDLVEPDALEKLHLRLTLEESDRVAYVYPAVRHFHQHRGGQHEVLGVDRIQYRRDRLLRDNYIPSFALINRQVYLAAGGMCEGHAQFWEDWDFWLRLSNLGFEGRLLNEDLFMYRRHATGRSAQIRRTVPEAEWRAELLRNNEPQTPGLDAASDVLDMAALDEGASQASYDHLPCYRAMSASRLDLLGRLNPAFAYFLATVNLARPRRLAARAVEQLRRPVVDLGQNTKAVQQPHRILFVVPWMKVRCLLAAPIHHA